MMLAKTPCIKNLEEKFSRQTLDDGFSINCDCFARSLRLKSSVVDCSCQARRRTLLICNGGNGVSQLGRNTLLGKDDFNSKCFEYKPDHLRLKADDAQSEKNDGWDLSKKILKRNTDEKNLQFDGGHSSHSKHFQQGSRLKAIVDEDGSCSSSDDEVSKLFFCKPNKNSIENIHSAEESHSLPVRETRNAALACEKFITVSLQEEKELNARKRIRGKHSSLRKKMKFSRPCLDMDKMLAHRIETFSSVQAV